MSEGRAKWLQRQIALYARVLNGEPDPKRKELLREEIKKLQLSLAEEATNK